MDDKHLELLVRMDERQKKMDEKIDTIAPIVKQNAADIQTAKTHIRVIKWIGGIVTALASYLGLTS